LEEMGRKSGHSHCEATALPLRFVARMLLPASMLVGHAGFAPAQDYPIKPIRIITAEVASSPDFVSRLVAHAISGPLGRNVIIENRASLKAIDLVAFAPPDGYTLLVGSVGTLATAPLLQKLSFDPIKDLSPITLIIRQPNIVVVTPSLPVKSIKDLIAFAKAKPAQLNYASSTTGSANHLAAEMFKAMAGVSLVRINYKGMGQGITDLIGGHVQVAFPAAASVMAHIQSGKLRALAVTTTAPYPLIPDLPTVAGSGLPGYESASIYGMFAPGKTAPARTNRINQEVVRFLQTAEAKEKFLTAGSEVVFGAPRELGIVLKSEMVKWGKVIKDAGIKAD
jgi:tripartite-type tricarboxylate transporter receptor subunit TctC